METHNTARELLSKHLFLHGGDGLGISDSKVYMAVLDAIQEALRISVVIPESVDIIEWQSECGDGCCHNYGITVVSGETTVEANGMNPSDVVEAAFEAIGIKCEVNYKYDG